MFIKKKRATQVKPGFWHWLYNPPYLAEPASSQLSWVLEPTLPSLAGFIKLAIGVGTWQMTTEMPRQIAISLFYVTKFCLRNFHHWQKF